MLSVSLWNYFLTFPPQIREHEIYAEEKKYDPTLFLLLSCSLSFSVPLPLLSSLIFPTTLLLLSPPTLHLPHTVCEIKGEY